MSRASRSLVIPNHTPIEVYPIQHGKLVPGTVLRACVTHNRTWMLIEIEDRAKEKRLRVYCDNLADMKDAGRWPANVSFKKLGGEDINALGVLGLIRSNKVVQSKREAQFEEDYQSHLRSMEYDASNLVKAGVVKRINIDRDKMRSKALAKARKLQKYRDKRDRELKQRRVAQNARYAETANAAR